MHITEIFGKRAQSGEWIVQEMDEAVRPAMIKRTENRTTFVKVRDDLDQMQRRARSGLGPRLVELREKGHICVKVSSTFDKSNRVSVKEKVVIGAKEVKPLSPRVARICLNPFKYGFLFEECDAEGRVRSEWKTPDKVERSIVVSTPRVSAEVRVAELAAEKAALEAELARLRAEAASATEKAAAPPKKRKPRKSKKADVVEAPPAES